MSLSGQPESNMISQNLKIMNITYKSSNQVIKYEVNITDFQNISSGKSRVQSTANEIKSTKSTTV